MTMLAYRSWLKESKTSILRLKMALRALLSIRNVLVGIRDPSAKLAMSAPSNSLIPSVLANLAKTSLPSPTTLNEGLISRSVLMSARPALILLKSTLIARTH